MKIGYFTDVYDPKIDGVVFSLHQFEDELRAMGHEVYVFAPRIKRGYRDTRPDVYRFPSIPSFLYPDIRLAVPNVPRLLHNLPKFQLDLIHSHTPILGPFAEFASLRLGIPHVHTYHTMIDEYVALYVPGVRSWNKKLMARINRTFLNRTDHVVAPSVKILKELGKLGVTTPIEVIPTGVRLEEFRDIPASAFRKAHGLPESAPVVLYLGRIAREKNLVQLVRSFRLLRRRLPDSWLVIAGKGPHEGELRTLARKLKVDDRTIFTGYLSREEVAGAMRDASVFVFPSLTDTQGLVLLEAAASGLPVVACDPEITEALVPGHNGLIAKNSARDIADRTHEILSDPAIWARMGRASRLFAAEFSARRQAERMLELYKRVTLA